MVILITGITSGFGRAMAERLSAEGHKVYGTHRKATEFIPVSHMDEVLAIALEKDVSE